MKTSETEKLEQEIEALEAQICEDIESGIPVEIAIKKRCQVAQEKSLEQ